MQKPWTLQYLPEYQASIEEAGATKDLRIETARNKTLIAQMLQFKPKDEVDLQYIRRGKVLGGARTEIDRETIVEPLFALAEADIPKIVGLVGLNRTSFINVLRSIYGQHVDEDTLAHIASFKKVQK